MAEVARPVGLAELVADQPIDGLGIGDAQQRLGEAEQCHAFLRGQRVFVQERVDAALAEPLTADRNHQMACRLGDSIAGGGRHVGGGEDMLDRRGLLDPAAVADRGAQWRDRRQRGGEYDIHDESLSRAPLYDAIASIYLLTPMAAPRCLMWCAGREWGSPAPGHDT